MAEPCTRQTAKFGSASGGVFPDEYKVIDAGEGLIELTELVITTKGKAPVVAAKAGSVGA